MTDATYAAIQNYELFGDHGDVSLATTLKWAGRGSLRNRAMLRLTRVRRAIAAQRAQRRYKGRRRAA